MMALWSDRKFAASGDDKNGWWAALVQGSSDKSATGFRDFLFSELYYSGVAVMATLARWRFHEWIAVFMWVVALGYPIAYLLDRRDASSDSPGAVVMREKLQTLAQENRLEITWESRVDGLATCILAS